MKNSRVIYISGIFNLFISISLITAENLSRPDSDLTPVEFIKKKGYEAEEHMVITEDGYKLTLHRIPGKAGSAPVFLQHGILYSSLEWLISDRNNSLGFVLADHGYDVWLGNARGNAYSRSHVKEDISSQKFWDFSWHEMGIYDLPAVINYITNMKNESLLYIGHSMGSTMFFVMASEKPEMATKVKAMFALAPVAYFHYLTHPLRHLHPIVDSIESLLKSFEIYELLPPDIRKLVVNYAKKNCFKKELFNENNICAKAILELGGGDASRFNYETLRFLVPHMTMGGSVKTVIHYFQHTDFRKFNYGTAKNLEIYNCYEAPPYNVSKVQVPVGLFWARKDTYFSHFLDVKKLYDLLPNKILSYEVPNREYSHTDFIIGIDSSKDVYPKLLSVMKNYR